MAYVIGKSEKNTNSIQKASISAEKQPFLNMRYETENTKIMKSVPTLPKIIAPFGSTSIKATLNHPEISNDPGPGSYDIDLNINKNLLSPGDNSNKFFITGDTRFKTKDNHVPGVGEYELINTSLNNNNKNILTPKKINKNIRITSHDFKSPRRIPSIPDKDTKFGFVEDKEGKMEIIKDPYKNQKFDGTRSNSIGPDRYNTILIKHNNAMDWKKAAKKTLELSKIKNKTDEFYDNYKYVNNLTNNSSNNNFDVLSEFYNYTYKTEGDVINSNNKKNQRVLNYKNSFTNRSTKSNLYNKNRIYKNENLGFKDHHDTSYIDLTSIPIRKKTKVITPGPGAYDPNIGNFNFEPKRNKFQNFGTYVSRNMFPIQRIKNSKNFLDKNNIYKAKNNNKSFDDKNKLNKFVRSLHNLKINLLKEQAMKIKKEKENIVGPGSYSPDLYFNIGNTINAYSKNNNNSRIEKKDDRNPIYISINENPGVGEYDVMGEIKKEIDYFLYMKRSKENKAKNDLKLKMENIRKNIKKKKEKKEIIIRKEYKDTEEYKIRQQFINNNYRPAFASAEPKFKEIGKKDDTNIGVGSYNLLYPEKKVTQIKIPFLSGAKKWSNSNFNKSNELNPNVGPGTYEQKSFFDWNKKSFNVQYKFK